MSLTPSRSLVRWCSRFGTEMSSAPLTLSHSHTRTLSLSHSLTLSHSHTLTQGGVRDSERRCRAAREQRLLDLGHHRGCGQTQTTPLRLPCDPLCSQKFIHLGSTPLSPQFEQRPFDLGHHRGCGQTQTPAPDTQTPSDKVTPNPRNPKPVSISATVEAVVSPKRSTSKPEPSVGYMGDWCFGWSVPRAATCQSRSPSRLWYPQNS